MVFEQVYNNCAREASLADDARFLKESLHVLKKKSGGVGAAHPICTHDVFITVLKGAVWVLLLLAG